MLIIYTSTFSLPYTFICNNFAIKHLQSLTYWTLLFSQPKYYNACLFHCWSFKCWEITFTTHGCTSHICHASFPLFEKCCFPLSRWIHFSDSTESCLLQQNPLVHSDVSLRAVLYLISHSIFSLSLSGFYLFLLSLSNAPLCFTTSTCLVCPVFCLLALWFL